MNDKKTTFILGAGFSRAILDEMPLLNDLSELIEERIKKDDNIIKELWQKYYIEKGMKNFEELLTILSQYLPWKDKSEYHEQKALYEKIKEHLVDIINEKEGKIYGNFELENHLIKFFEYLENNNSTVITFNYDTIIEALFSKFKKEKFDEQISTRDLFQSFPLINLMSRRKTVPGDREHRKYFNILKLHGSINWFCSESSQFNIGDVYIYEKYIYEVTFKEKYGEKESERNVEEFKKNTRDLSTLIIPPILDKKDFHSWSLFKLQWTEAKKKIENSDRVVIIGYSLPKTDLTVGLLLKMSFQKHVELIPVDVSESIVDRLKEEFPSLKIVEDFIHKENPFKKFIEEYL